MQLVQFAGADPFLVDDGLGEALVQYAWELATYRRHDLVQLPALEPGGARITVTLLLGPALPLSTRSTPDVAGLGDHDATGDLRRRAARLRASMLMGEETDGLHGFEREPVA